MKKKYLVPVTWLVYADIIIEAEDEQQAIQLAYEAPLPKGEYVSDSFVVITGEIKEHDITSH